MGEEGDRDRDKSRELGGGGMDDGKTWRIHLWYLFQRSKRPVDIPSIVKSI